MSKNTYMKLLFQNYISGFFVWWYFVNLVELVRTMYFFLWGVLERFKLPEMLSNLFIPLYQDESTIGKILSFFIRFIWIAIGSIASLVVIAFMFLSFAIYLTLPFLPILIVIFYA